MQSLASHGRPAREDGRRASGGETPALYALLLGAAWSDVHPAVRRLHLGGPGERTGRFQVRCGATLRARCLARLFRLPPAGEEVTVRLAILQEAGGEVWRRTFGAHRLVSRQLSHPGGLLAERFQGIECRFRLEPAGDGIAYRHVATALRLGPWALPLPRALAPYIEAEERPVEGGGAPTVRVRVRMSVPWAGDLLCYEGELSCEEERPS